jgi:hypothetical protein
MRWFLVLPIVLLVSPLGAQTPSPGTVDIISGPQSLVVASAIAGLGPDAVSDATTRLSVTAAGSGARLTARLLSLLPTGVTLELRASASNGTSVGTVPLSTTSTEVLRDLPAGTQAGVTITYTLRASITAGTVAFSSVQVVFELVGGS